MLVSVHHHSRIWETCLQQCAVFGIELYVGFNEYVNQHTSLLIGSLLDTRFAKEMKILVTEWSQKLHFYEYVEALIHIVN